MPNEWMNSGQYSNGEGFNGGMVYRDAFGSTYDANNRQVYPSWTL